MSDSWQLQYTDLRPESQGLREALCTLGNGVYATRGAAEEERASRFHYPGTYVAGGYNEVPTALANREVRNEDLVNFPNWLLFTIQIDGEAPLRPFAMAPLSYEQTLDLERGVLRRQYRIKDSSGRITAVESLRLVHMEHHHLAALRVEITAENWSGELLLRSGLDADVVNDNVPRYRQLESRHLEVLSASAMAPEGIALKVRTTNSDIVLAQAARTRIKGVPSGELERRIDYEARGARVMESIYCTLKEGATIRAEKTVAQFTSRDRGIGDLSRTARIALTEAPDFDALLESHELAMARHWRRCDIQVKTRTADRPDGHEQRVIRLHIFHLLQTASPNTVGRDVGIPARGLHGEAYRGHIFWDELFILPFYIQRFPSIARSTILYRYNRLTAARRLAHQMGCVGAAFPWQSGSDGMETTQEFHLNPLSGKWSPDHSHLQRHINSAIAINIWNYFEATDDQAFLEEYGAELLLEIARFWSSLATYNQDLERFEIHGVMGPDEYHEKYPDAEKGGLSNNVYTNITAVWCLLRARDALEQLSIARRFELEELLHIDAAELERWEAISTRMRVVFHGDQIISQFEGYGDLEEFPWEEYRRKYENIERLDRILEAEGKTTDAFRVSKQADMTMLLYLFPQSELLSLFHRLGYEITEEDLLRNIEYYEARTSHGSTLSRVVFTSALHRYQPEEGGDLFLAALESDLCDIQGGTTQEGIHLGAMAGTLDIVTRYYAGLEYLLDRICFMPRLPPHFEKISFRVVYRHRWLDITLTEGTLQVSLDRDRPEPILLEIEGITYDLSPGECLIVSLQKPSPTPQPGQTTSMAPPLSSRQ